MKGRRDEEGGIDGVGRGVRGEIHAQYCLSASLDTCAEGQYLEGTNVLHKHLFTVLHNCHPAFQNRVPGNLRSGLYN